MNKELNDDLANLSGAYALDALDADEAKDFERALERSDQTRYEVTELRDTAVLLGLATAPVQPSAQLKTNIMAAIAATPQLPATETDHEISRQKTVREFELPSTAARKAQARWFTRPATYLVAAAAAVVLIVGGVVAGNGYNTFHQDQVAASQFAAISTASDVKRVDTTVTGGGTATVMWSASHKSAAVKLDGVATLPSNKVYELWYIGKGGVARGAGTFSAADGAALQVLTGSMQSGDAIGVTVEPSGGSTKPTTAPVVAVATA